MKTLTIGLAMLATSHGATGNDLDKAFHMSALANNLDEKLLRAVCWVESGHNPHALNIADGDGTSVGICQVKTATARTMGFKGTFTELRNPTVNIMYAGRYLAFQMKRYAGDWKKAVTAYNRGHFRGRVNNTYVLKVALAMLEDR